MNEIDHLIKYRNKLQDDVYKLLEQEYTSITKFKLAKYYKEIDKVNRRINKLEILENAGIQVYEPNSEFI